MDTLFTISHDPQAEGPEFADKFPVTLAEGKDAGQMATIALVNGAIRDERILQIVLDAAAALVANAGNSEQMLQIFACQVEKNRELAARMASGAKIEQ